MVYSLFQSLYNWFYKKNAILKPQSTEPYETEYDKSKKIQLFLQIRHIKNIYYKYTKNILFREQLYNEFSKENDFDYGECAYDDENGNISIFDTYICRYIEKRKEFINELQNKGSEYELFTNIPESNDNKKQCIVFIIDMTDRNILDYCMSHHNDKLLDTLLSAVIIENNQRHTKLLR